MAGELCFYINEKNIYLDKVLVDYENIPVFFVCKDDLAGYYIALCTDIENFNYVLAEVPVMDLSDMLHGRLPMRDAITRQNAFWEIQSGDDVISDKVKYLQMKDIDKSCLPDEGARFKILTKEIESYAKGFENLSAGKSFSEINTKKESYEMLLSGEYLTYTAQKTEDFLNVYEFSGQIVSIGDELKAVDFNGQMLKLEENSGIVSIQNEVSFIFTLEDSPKKILLAA